MGLLSDMRAYLQRVQSGATSMLAERSTLDRGPLRGLVHAAVEEENLRVPKMNWRASDQLLRAGDVLISEVLQHVADIPGLAGPAELPGRVHASLCEILCDHFYMTRREGLGVESLRSLQSSLVEQAGRDAYARYRERVEQEAPSPRLYALELGLVQMVAGKPRMAPLGEVFLRLTGVDATRWPLAIELLTAIDRDDPWRGHESLAKELLARRTLMAHAHEFQYGAGWPWDNPALTRWASIGLLKREHWKHGERTDEPDGGESYKVTELGALLFEELLRDPDAPIKSFARALLEDASDGMLDVVPRPGGAASSVVRHTRMLAHEMRNALVPVRFAYDQLWTRLPRDDVRVALHRQHVKITEGLERALRFVTDAARAVSSFTEESAIFLVGAALQDACVSATASTGVRISLEVVDGAEHIHLRGARARLVMAVVNILRNAVQAGGPDVEIAATLSRADGYVAVLVLEDSGPGIPATQRDKLFESGHSTHKHGTGHGLSLVREVVEQDFSGSVHYETSPLGGARFVLRFPIPNEAT